MKILSERTIIFSFFLVSFSITKQPLMLGNQDGLIDINFNYISPHKLSLLILIRLLVPTPVRQENKNKDQENENLNDRHYIRIKDDDISSIWTDDEECKPYVYS